VNQLSRIKERPKGKTIRSNDSGPGTSFEGEMISTATRMRLTLGITEEIHVRASLDGDILPARLREQRGRTRRNLRAGRCR